MIVIASGDKGLKSYELFGEEGTEFYVAKFREAAAPPNKAKVYYKATSDFFEIVADCQAWLDEVTPAVDGLE